MHEWAPLRSIAKNGDLSILHEALDHPVDGDIEAHPIRKAIDRRLSYHDDSEISVSERENVLLGFQIGLRVGG